MSELLTQQDSLADIYLYDQILFLESKKGSVYEIAQYQRKNNQSEQSRSQSRRTTIQMTNSPYRRGSVSLMNFLMLKERGDLNNTSSDKLSRFGSQHSNQKGEEQKENVITDKTQISVKKYYQGTENYKAIVKIKLVPYEQKLNSPFIAIENLDQKTIFVRNKPDKFIKQQNKQVVHVSSIQNYHLSSILIILYLLSFVTFNKQYTRDISNLSKDKIQSFSGVFGENESSEVLILKSLQEPVKKLLEGYNQSILIYGGANSGKTHLAFGSLRDPGLMVLLMKEVLYNRNELEEVGINITVKISICQYSKDQFYDCIIGHQSPLEVHEDSQQQLYVAGLCEVEVRSLLQAMRQHIIKIVFKHTQIGQHNYIYRDMNRVQRNQNKIQNQQILYLKQNAYKKINVIQTKRILFLHQNQLNLSRKHLKMQQQYFYDIPTIGSGAQNSVLAPLNNCFRLLSEINQKTKKTNKIPYKSNNLIEYIRDCIGGNSYTYLIGCANPLAEHVSDTEAMIRHLNFGKHITTTPEIIKYSNISQHYQLEIYQKSIRDNIKGWIEEFFSQSNNGPLNSVQQFRLKIIGNILSRIQQYLNKILKIYSMIQENTQQLNKINLQIIDHMSRAYSKCITSSDVKEFYIGKLQQYNIDTFKEINFSHYQVIELVLNKQQKLKMKVEVWENKLVKLLKLKELRKQRPEDLQQKDIEKLVLISKQSKKLYQFYNEQVCLGSFDYMKSNEILENLFDDINQIRLVQSLTQIPTLQQINSSQFIELKNRNSQLSFKSFEDSNINSPMQHFSAKKSTSFMYQLSRTPSSNKIQLPSLFQQQQTKDYQGINDSSRNSDSNTPQQANSSTHKTHSNSPYQAHSNKNKNFKQKSQFLIMNMLGQESEEFSSKEGSRDDISENSEDFENENEKDGDEQENENKENNEYTYYQDDEYVDTQQPDQQIDIQKLQKKYGNIKKKNGEPTKIIYINNKKIEVKKKALKSRRQGNSDLMLQQNSLNKSSVVTGGENSILNQIDRQNNNIQDSINYNNTQNQLLSQDQSLISQIPYNNKINEDFSKGYIGIDQIGTNQSNLNVDEKYQSINQLLQMGNESGFISQRISQSSNQAQNNEQGILIQDSILSQDLSKQQESKRNSSQQLNLPNLSQLLDNQQNEQQKNEGNLISNIPSNINTSQLNNAQKVYDNISIEESKTKRNLQLSLNDNTLLSISPQLELDDDLLNGLFQTSKSSSGNVVQSIKRQNNYKNQVEEYQIEPPRNIYSLHGKKGKQNSLVQLPGRQKENIQFQNKLQLKSPIQNFNLVSKKLSLINLRGIPQYNEAAVKDENIGYFRTQLKEEKGPKLKEYFFELLSEHLNSALKNDQNKQLIKLITQNVNSLTNINESFSKILNKDIQSSTQLQNNDTQQNANENQQPAMFQRYEHENELNLRQSKKPINNSLEKDKKTNKDIKKKSMKQQDFRKDQITFKLPNIHDSLHHRSKYSKFFLN